MLALQMIALLASATLPWAAVVAFRWSPSAARFLLSAATLTALLGALAGAVSGRGVVAASSLGLLCAGLGCNLIGARQLVGQPPRWIHRFVIYAGYGATFGAMAAAGLWLERRTASPTLATVVW